MGQYLEITQLNLPSQAGYGQTVTGYVYVRNRWNQGITCAVTAGADGIEIQAGSQVIGAGDTKGYILSFTMPGRSLLVRAGAWFWGTDSQWHEDDQETGTIALSGGGQETTADGEIRNVGIKHSSSGGQYKSPPTEIPYGEQVIVRFDGLNLSSDSRYLYGYLQLVKPGGASLFAGGDWSNLPYSPGSAHHFYFPGSYSWSNVLDEVGTYRIYIWLYVNIEGGSELVSEYTGEFTVAAEEEPPGGASYVGRIENIKVMKTLYNWQPKPVAVEQGSRFSVYFEGWNDSDARCVLLGEVTITKPGGEVETASDESSLSYDPSTMHKFYFNQWSLRFTADEVGDYQARIIVKGRMPGGSYHELDSWEGKILTVTAAEPPSDGETPSGKAEIVYMALDYRLLGAGQPIPVVEAVPVPEHARLSVIARTAGTERERLRAEVWIYSPASETEAKYHYADTSSFPCCDPDAQHEFIFPSPTGTFVIDEAGQWNLKVHITDAQDNELLQSYDGVFFNGEETPESPWAMLTSLMPMMMIMMMFAMMVPMMRETAGELEEGVK